MTERYLIAFLEEIAKRGTGHRLVDLYLHKVTKDSDYANPFRYYVAYEAAEHMGPDEAAETAHLLNAASAECIMRGSLGSPGGDPSGYDPTHPGLTRGYTSAIVRLAEEVAYNRHPDSENIADADAVLEKAMRDFAHNLHWAVSGAEADLYTCSQEHGKKP